MLYGRLEEDGLAPSEDEVQPVSDWRDSNSEPNYPATIGQYGEPIGILN